MNRVLALPSVMAGALAALFAVGATSAAANAGAASDIELMCLTEQPVILEGGSATLRAWVSAPDGRPAATPVAFRWRVDAGGVDADAATARWNLAAVKARPQSARKVTATVTAARPGKEAVQCVVEARISKKGAPVGHRGLLSAKRYLFPGRAEEAGFGLYSYVLLSAPPKNDEERARYLKTIEAYLLVLQEVDDYLARHVAPASLNATYIPLSAAPRPGKSDAERAVNVLAVYDYATAAILLRRVKEEAAGGPYLISALAPLSRSDSSARLHEDLAGVTPDLAWDWVRYFTYLAAQQRSWSEANLQRVGLQLRNVIAVGGKVAPQVMEGLSKAIRFEPMSRRK